MQNSINSLIQHSRDIKSVGVNDFNKDQSGPAIAELTKVGPSLLPFRRT